MRKKLFQGRGHVLLVAFFAMVLAASAQTNSSSQGVVKGFNVPGEYFDSPNDQQMKSLIQGAEARPIGNNRFQLTQLKLTTFLPNGQEDMIIEAADCLFDNEAHIANSPSSLTVHSADGQFTLEGIGFQWQQTNSLLYISNEVHSVLHKTAAATPGTTPGAENGDIQVVSDHFTRDLKSGLSVYHDNVHVTGTNVMLAADQMTLNLPLTNGVITLSSNATWASGARNGGADELDIDRVTNSLTAIGNGFLKMPGAAMGTNSTQASTNKTVEILADRYVLMTNWAEFHGNVRVTQFDSNQPSGKLTSELMTADISGGNAIQSVVAQTNVVVEQQDGRFTGEMAQFFATNSTAIFSGKPTWSKGDRSGAGEILFVDQGQSQMTVWSNAMMKLPGNTMGPATNTTVPTFTTVTSDNYSLKAGHAEFHGNAHIVDPKMNVTSDLLTADSLPGSTNIERVVADKHVVSDLTDSNGKITHVTSDHALYTLSDGLLRLTGTPVLKNDQGWLTGSIIVWDRTYDLLIARNQRMIFQGTNGPGELPSPFGSN